MMNILKYRRQRPPFWAALFFLLVPCLALANGEAHLLFHMGVGANGKYYVGGTIQNNSEQPIERGYIVIVPVNERCQPQQPLLQVYGPVAMGQKIEFNIPIEGQLNGYRLGSFAAFDSMGFAIPTVDDTAQVIAERLPDDRLACELKNRPGNAPDKG